MHQDRFSETTLSATIASTIERSPQVARWLFAAVAERLGWSADRCSVHAVCHSFTDSTVDSRETDVLAIYHTGNTRRCWVLVEVKINAPFGDRQPEDYAVRKATVVASKRCECCGTVVIAPARYLQSHPREVRLFDSAVELEQLRSAAAESPELAAKLLINHIGIAMAIFEMGYVPLVSAVREQQIEWYDSFVRAYKPHLVPNPTNASKQVRDRFFPVPQRQRKYGYITHRIFAGEVSMGFMQRSHMFECVRAKLARAGDDGVQPEVRGTSLYFVLDALPVPALDEHASFAEQEQSVKRGVDAVDMLHQWAIHHCDVLRDVVDNHC